MNYSDIFDLRGAMYNEAMRRFPNVRDLEFQLPLNLCDLNPNDTLVDMPAGGGYLRDYIDSRIELICLESSQQFVSFCKLNNLNVYHYSDDTLPLKDNTADAIVSIAGLHHVEKKTQILSEMRRILKPDGKFCIADVEEGSNVALFLDDIVDKYTETGHEGIYFSKATKQGLHLAGFQSVQVKRLKYTWKFESTDEMVEFCRLLFSLTKATPEMILNGIKKYLNVEYKNSQVHMEWGLIAFSNEKPGK